MGVMELDQVERLVAARKKIGSGVTAKQIRQAAGLTQTEVAEHIGITQTALSRLEAGTRQPRVDTLLRWAEALHEMEKRLQRATRRTAA